MISTKSIKGIKSSLMLAMATMLTACSYSPEQLIAKIDADGRYTQQVRGEQCHYTLQWLPKEYMAAVELVRNTSKADTAVAHKVGAYSQAYYFRLSLELPTGDNTMLSGVEGTPGYAARWNYLAYGMGKNLYLLTPQYDTIFPVHYTFQNPYIYHNRVSLLYVFSKKALDAQEGDLDLRFRDELIAGATARFTIKEFSTLRGKTYNLTIKN